MSASVKVMLSYDYCHFEISKSTDQPVTDGEIDEMRKDCMRLADKAIAQYKIAKNWHYKRQQRADELRQMEREVAAIEAKSECDRTPNEMALVKTLRDRDWKEYIEAKYGYEDEWDED